MLISISQYFEYAQSTNASQEDKTLFFIFFGHWHKEKGKAGGHAVANATWIGFCSQISRFKASTFHMGYVLGKVDLEMRLLF